MAMTAAVLGAATALWAAPRKVTLELKASPGDQLRYVSSLTMAMDMTVQDPTTGNQLLSVAPRLVGSATTITRVQDVSKNGDLTASSRVESFDISLDVADLHARLAIVGPDGGPPQLIKLPELPVRAVVSKRGKALAIEGLEELPIPPVPMPGGGSISLPEMINKFVTKFSQPMYPDRPVAVGDTWSWEMVFDPAEMAELMGMPMPPEAKEQMGAMTMPIKCTSTLAALEKMNGVECARIEAESPRDLNMAAGPPEAGGMMLKESGSTKVTTWFDYAAGRAVREVTDMHMTMRLGNEEITLVRMEMRGTGETNLK
jgi:hypothetical protein